MDQKCAPALNMFYVLTGCHAYTVEQLLKLGNYTQAMQRVDGLYECHLANCVREALRRSNFSYKKFVRHAKTEMAAAEDIVSMTGILALVCKNFSADIVVANEDKKKILTKGPWRDSAKTWFHRNWFGLYSRHRQNQANPLDQVHVTQAPEMILQLAKFLALNGDKALSSLPKSSVATMAAYLSAAFDKIVATECNWLVAEMAFLLEDLAKKVAAAGLGYEAPEGSVLACLKVIADSN
jgi:hypothetical protein